MLTYNGKLDSVAVAPDESYTDPQRRGTTQRDDRSRRQFMFKKTEETEWTRFSKALSGRERDESEPVAEAEPAPAPLPPAPAPVTRPANDVHVSSRAASRAPAPEIDEDVESVIGARTVVDGAFKSESSIRVCGTVQGEIESKHSIIIETEASVTAKVTAETVTVSGAVNGQIFCNGRVEIRPSGRVVGEIHAGTLIMQEGAFFEGHLKMVGREAPEAKRVS